MNEPKKGVKIKMGKIKLKFLASISAAIYLYAIA
jgi:hypothetical protein